MIHRRRVPAVGDPAPPGPDGQKSLVPWQPRSTVLLIEDDTEMREMLAWTLRRDGHVVIEAADGDDALEWLGIGILDGESSHLPTLIVSDVRLPYFTGLDILEGVSISPRRIPVILITGFGDEETHARALELGAVCVLDKPFPIEALRNAVCAALEPRPEAPPSARVLRAD